MYPTYNFYELCGKYGSTQKRILEELHGLGIDVTRNELRERLARAVQLGFMIRKSGGHIFSSKLCDKHVIALLGTAPTNSENSLEKLMDDINAEETKINEKKTSNTDVISLPSNSTSLQVENEKCIEDKNTEEDNKNEENCFLKECWQQVGTFIDGLEQNTTKNRNYNTNNPIQQQMSLKIANKIDETLSEAAGSSSSENNGNEKEIFETGNNEDEEIELKYSESNIVLNKLKCIQSSKLLEQDKKENKPSPDKKDNLK